jgi:hypothetical protein
VAQDSWPSPAHNDRAVTDAEYEIIAERMTFNGIHGDPTHDAVVSAGPGLTVIVRANVYGNLRGFAWHSGSTEVTLPIAANSSGQTRIDLVVLRLDRSDWSVRAVVKQGTPGAGTPALTLNGAYTGVYEMRLAVVTVLSGASSVTVKRNELYVGSRIRACTSSTRNPVPALGEMCFETDTGQVRMWTGSAWTSVFDDPGIVSADSPLSTWSIETGSDLEKRNGNVHFRLGSFKRTAANFTAPTDSRLPVLIPAAYQHPTHHQFAIVYVTGAQIGRVTIYPASHERAGQVWLTHHPDMETGEYVLGSVASWVVS